MSTVAPTPTRSTVPAGAGAATRKRLWHEAHAYADDPVGWSRRRGIWLWSKQREILQSVVENRYTAARSCHGIGKSFDAAVAAAWWLAVHPIGDAFVVTTAPSERQVYAILWREIRKLHRRLGLDGRVTLDANWYMGDNELVAYGRKPADYDQDSFQGIHARYVLVILDEAGGIPKPLYDAVDSLATNDNSRVLAIGNPDDPNTQFEKVCRPGSGWNEIAISAFDSPNFTGEEVPDELRELLVNRTWVEERAHRWGVNSPLYQSKVLGRFPEVSDDSLITPGDIRAAVERELPGLDVGCYALDVARFGTDKSVIYRNRGGVMRKEWEREKQRTTKTTGEVVRFMRKLNRRTYVVVDATGVGAGVADRLIEKGLEVVEFEGGRRASDPERFENLRAEMYWDLRRRFEDGEVDLDPDDDVLQAQLGSIKFGTRSSGRIYIESKDDMKKRGLPSPDHADSVMMTLYKSSSLDNFLNREHSQRQPDRNSRVRPEGDLTSDLLGRPM